MIVEQFFIVIRFCVVVECLSSLIYGAHEGRNRAFSLLYLQCLAHSNCSRNICKWRMVFPEVASGPGKLLPLVPPCGVPPPRRPGLTVFLVEQILHLLPQRVGDVDPGESGVIIFCKVRNNYGFGLFN